MARLIARARPPRPAGLAAAIERPRIAAKRRQDLVSAALLLPALLFLALWFVLPLGQLLALSFDAPGGAFAAYADLLESQVFRQVFINTLVLAFTVAVIGVALAYPAAYLMTGLSSWVLALAVWCMLMPLWISVLVRTFSWMLLLETNGPINATLVAVGLVEQPLALLFNATGVYIGMVHVLLPYAIVPIYTAMRNLDPHLLLASEGLGASPWTTFWRIYFPLTLPGVVAAFVFVFLLALGFFITPALLGGIRSITVPMLIDQFVTERLVWSLAAAASVLSLLLILAALLVAGRSLRLGELLVAR